MSTAETAVRTVAPAAGGVPAPRPAPAQEDRRRHDGWYWDVDACGWQRSERTPSSSTLASSG